MEKGSRAEAPLAHNFCFAASSRRGRRLSRGHLPNLEEDTAAAAITMATTMHTSSSPSFFLFPRT